jgi:hypothetical protein
MGNCWSKSRYEFLSIRKLEENEPAWICVHPEINGGTRYQLFFKDSETEEIVTVFMTFQVQSKYDEFGSRLTKRFLRNYASKCIKENWNPFCSIKRTNRWTIVFHRFPLQPMILPSQDEFQKDKSG